MRVHHHCVLCIAMTEELFFAYILQTNLQRLHCCISSQSQMACDDAMRNLRKSQTWQYQRLLFSKFGDLRGTGARRQSTRKQVLAGMTATTAAYLIATTVVYNM